MQHLASYLGIGERGHEILEFCRRSFAIGHWLSGAYLYISWERSRQKDLVIIGVPARRYTRRGIGEFINRRAGVRRTVLRIIARCPDRSVRFIGCRMTAAGRRRSPRSVFFEPINGLRVRLA